MIILKVTKKVGFHLLSRKHVFRKTAGGCQIDPPSPFLGLIIQKFSSRLNKILFVNVYYLLLL